MITLSPLTQPISGDGVVPPGWSSWFTLIDRALSGVKRSFSFTETIDFGSIAAQSQLASVVASSAASTGARVGDAVTVTPTSDVSGLIFTGVVTANDTVTVYAKNFTIAAIDPASQVFRISILNN